MTQEFFIFSFCEFCTGKWTYLGVTVETGFLVRERTGSFIATPCPLDTLFICLHKQLADFGLNGLSGQMVSSLF